MYADSGASDHCFVDQEVFSEYKPLTSPREGHSASVGGIFCIVSHGVVKRTVKMRHGTSELVFKRALHTPDLAANLISVGKFDKARFLATFAVGQVTFKDTNGHEVLVRN